MRKGVPSRHFLGSTATEARGVRGAPWAPSGPSAGSPERSSKKTKLGFCASASSVREGLARAQARIRCIESACIGIPSCSESHLPIAL